MNAQKEGVIHKIVVVLFDGFVFIATGVKMNINSSGACVLVTIC